MSARMMGDGSKRPVRHVIDAINLLKLAYCTTGQVVARRCLSALCLSTTGYSTRIVEASF